MGTARTSLLVQQVRKLTADSAAAGQADGELLARFAERRDEAAFPALVQRHGRMVLSVCRSVLRHEHDAEDAFQAAVRRRRRRLWHKARLKCRRPHRGQLALCAWGLYVTNVPAAQLSVAEALLLGRCRWQVELLFKLWKSQGQIDASPSGKPHRVLCEVDGKLLAMVVQHWVTLLRWGTAVGQSVRKAARKVRQHALHLASVLRVAGQLRRVLLLLLRCLGHGVKINRRRKEPALFQLLLAPPEVPGEVPKKPPKVAA
jgi:hypothetical protein